MTRPTPIREDSEWNYAIGWGVTTPEPPYFTDVKDADWNTIFQHETEWKKSKDFV